jgi:hypothetical protein
MTRRDILLGIIKKNGAKYQMGVVIEELAELTKELTKHLRNKGSAMHTCEEIADVEICLEQLKLIMPHSALQIGIFKRFKFERLQKLYLEGGER